MGRAGGLLLRGVALAATLAAAAAQGAFLDSAARAAAGEDDCVGVPTYEDLLNDGVDLLSFTVPQRLLFALCAMVQRLNSPLSVDFEALLGKYDDPEQYRALVAVGRAAGNASWTAGSIRMAEEYLMFSPLAQEMIAWNNYTQRQLAEDATSGLGLGLADRAYSSISLGYMFKYLPFMMGFPHPWRWVNGLAWGTPGVSYCLWQGVDCCLQYASQNKQSQRNYTALWPQLAEYTTVAQLRDNLGYYRPQGFRQSSPSRFQQFQRPPESTQLFQPLVEQSLDGLVQSGYAVEMTYTCVYPFAVYNLDLTGVNATGTLAPAVASLPHLNMALLRNNPGLRGELPSGLLDLACLFQVNLKNTSMTCGDACPVPPTVQVLAQPSSLWDAAATAKLCKDTTTAQINMTVLNTTEPLAQRCVWGGPNDQAEYRLATRGNTVRGEIVAEPAFFEYDTCSCGEGTVRVNGRDGSFRTCELPGSEAHLIASVAVPVIVASIIALTVFLCCRFRRRLRAEVARARLEFAKRRYPPGSLPNVWGAHLLRKKRKVAPPAVLKYLHANVRAGEPKSIPVSIVVTDIEGSTALWEWNPKLMAKVNEVHDRIMRRTASQFMGYEVTTEGDSFTFAFHEASDACCFCLHVQKVLLETDWDPNLYEHEAGAVQYFLQGADVLSAKQIPVYKGVRVRMGIATGRAAHIRTHKLTKRKEYIGDVLWRGRTVSDAPVGGQILMDSLTAAMIESEADLRDLRYRLELEEGCKRADYKLSVVSNFFRGIKKSVLDWRRRLREERLARQASFGSGAGSSARSSNHRVDSVFSGFSGVPGGPPRSRLFSALKGLQSARDRGEALLDYDRLIGDGFGDKVLILDRGVHTLKSSLYADTKEQAPESLFELTNLRLLPRLLSFTPVDTKECIVPGFVDAPGVRESLIIAIKGPLGFDDLEGGEYDALDAADATRAKRDSALKQKRDKIALVMPEVAFLAIESPGPADARFNHLGVARKAAVDAFQHLLKLMLLEYRGAHQTMASKGVTIMAFDTVALAIEFAIELLALCRGLDLAKGAGSTGHSGGGRLARQTTGRHPRDAAQGPLLPACGIVVGKPKFVAPGGRAGSPIYVGKAVEEAVLLAAFSAPGVVALHTAQAQAYLQGTPGETRGDTGDRSPSRASGGVRLPSFTFRDLGLFKMPGGKGTAGVAVASQDTPGVPGVLRPTQVRFAGKKTKDGAGALGRRFATVRCDQGAVDAILARTMETAAEFYAAVDAQAAAEGGVRRFRLPLRGGRARKRSTGGCCAGTAGRTGGAGSEAALQPAARGSPPAAGGSAPA